MWVCFWDTNDVILWIFSGLYLKYTVWGQSAQKHTRLEWVLTKVLVSPHQKKP